MNKEVSRIRACISPVAPLFQFPETPGVTVSRHVKAYPTLHSTGRPGTSASHRGGQYARGPGYLKRCLFFVRGIVGTGVGHRVNLNRCHTDLGGSALADRASL